MFSPSTFFAWLRSLLLVFSNPKAPRRRLTSRPRMRELEPRLCPSSIPGLFGTGVDSGGHVPPVGVSDPHYRLISAPSPDQPGAAKVVVPGGFPFNGYWLPNSATSQWIAPHANENDFSGGVSEPAGNYVYETKFNLGGLDPATASIIGKVSADNTLVHVLLNGRDVGSASANAEQYRGFTPLSITKGFVPGLNRLDFVVTNLPQTAWPNNEHNPSGFRAELSGTAQPPSLAAPNLHYLVTEGRRLRVSAPDGLLAQVMAPAGDRLGAQLVRGPKYGQLQMRADGSFFYMPDKDFAGNDFFYYQVREVKGVAQSQPARVDFFVIAQAEDTPDKQVLNPVLLEEGAVKFETKLLNPVTFLEFERYDKNGKPELDPDGRPLTKLIGVPPPQRDRTDLTLKIQDSKNGLVLIDNQWLKLIALQPSWGVNMNATFNAKGVQPGKRDDRYYWVQYVKDTDYTFDPNTNQLKVFKEGDWELDTPAAMPGKPFYYRFQDPDQNHPASDLTLRALVDPVKGDPVIKDKTAVYELNKTVKKLESDYEEGIDKQFPGLKLLRFRQFQTYIVKAPDKAGQDPTPLGYVEWGFSQTIDKFNIDASLLGLNWKAGSDPKVWGKAR